MTGQLVSRTPNGAAIRPDGGVPDGRGSLVYLPNVYCQASDCVGFSLENINLAAGQSLGGGRGFTRVSYDLTETPGRVTNVRLV